MNPGSPLSNHTLSLAQKAQGEKCLLHPEPDSGGSAPCEWWAATDSGYVGAEPKVRRQMLLPSSTHGGPLKGLNRMTSLDFFFGGGVVPLYIGANLNWKHVEEFKLRKSTSVINMVLYEFEA